MNAPNPSSGDRDLEALRRAQQAHEPSMDEILASIRSIIADDEDPAPASARAPNSGATNGPQIVYSNDSIPPARSAARTPDAAPIPSDIPTYVVPSAPRVVWKTPRPARSLDRSAGVRIAPNGRRRRAACLASDGRCGLRRLQRTFSEHRDAKFREGRNPDARNAASDAQELARRQSAKSRGASRSR